MVFDTRLSQRAFSPQHFCNIICLFLCALNCVHLIPAVSLYYWVICALLNGFRCVVLLRRSIQC